MKPNTNALRDELARVIFQTDTPYKDVEFELQLAGIGGIGKFVYVAKWDTMSGPNKRAWLRKADAALDLIYGTPRP